MKRTISIALAISMVSSAAYCSGKLDNGEISYPARQQSSSTTPSKKEQAKQRDREHKARAKRASESKGNIKKKVKDLLMGELPSPVDLVIRIFDSETVGLDPDERVKIAREAYFEAVQEHAEWRQHHINEGHQVPESWAELRMADDAKMKKMLEKQSPPPADSGSPEPVSKPTPGEGRRESRPKEGEPHMISGPDRDTVTPMDNNA